MDGTLAAIFIIASLTDMTLNDCPTGCLTRSDAPARLVLQGAAVEFDSEIIGSELSVGYDFGSSYGPFQPAVLASLTDSGRIWVGAGARWEKALTQDGGFYVDAALMPGVDIGGSGPDLGGNLQFRASVGVGYAFDNGARLTLSYDHRSNGDIRALNPGLETISARYAITLD